MRASFVLPAFLAVLAGDSLSAQTPGRRVQPTGGEADAIRATRFFEDLQAGLSNGGARLLRDVDGDQDLDLLMLARQTNPWFPVGMQTWLHQGIAGFVLTHELDFEYPPTSDGFFDIAREVLLADVTGDGVQDLVYERKDMTQPTWWNHVGPNGVLVHPGAGNGSFGEPLLISEGTTFSGALGGMVVDVIAGDCDLDGDDDLLIQIVASAPGFHNYLRWWSYEDGAFVSSTHLDVEALRPMRMERIDIGGDGVPDAVAASMEGYDELLFFRTVAGAPTLFASVPLPSELHNINQYLKTGDIDGDGDEDALLVFDDVITTHNIYFQAALRQPSGFQLAPLQTFPNPTFDPIASREGVLADWDADGDLDYVSPIFTWLENTGGASFAPGGTRYAAWGNNIDLFPQVADLNADGHLDLLNGWMIAYGNGRMPGEGSVPAWDAPLNLIGQVEDWERDGDLDFVNPTLLRLNSGDGTFVNRNTLLPFTGQQLDPVSWGDFDGDGLRDSVVAAFDVEYPFPPVFDSMRLFTGGESGAYTLSAVVPSPVEMQVEGSMVADLDGDGDVDILERDGYWANDGAATFGSAPVAAYTGLPLVALDVDGDTDVDLLVGRAGRLEMLRNQGGLAFLVQDLGTYATGLQASFLDLEEDGDLDLVTVKPPVNGVLVREQLGAGVFAAAFSLAGAGPTGSTGLCDVNGDGRDDLVFGRQHPTWYNPVQLLSAWIRGAGLDFVERRDYVVRMAPTGFGDVDGDGDADTFGNYLVENMRFDGTSAGSNVQYALDGPTAGSGGVRPYLGAGGPLRPNAGASLALGRGLGGTVGWLLVGRERADTTSPTYPGVDVFVEPLLAATPIALAGAPGVPGAGTLEIPLAVTSALVGETFTFQAVLADAGAVSGLSATNGVEVLFGNSIPSGPPQGAGKAAR